MNKTQLIWDGCDGYVDLNSSNLTDLDITYCADGSATLHTRNESFTSFAAIKVAEVDGKNEENFENLFVCDGWIYIAAPETATV